MKVKRAMSKNVVSVSVPGNREKALSLMRQENRSVLPVIKEGTNKLVGLLARSDLIGNPDEDQIAMLMSRDLVTVSPDDDIEEAARRMIDNQVRRVPVVNDDEELVGIITSFDLVSQALANLDISNPVEDYMITTVPTTWTGTPLNVAFETIPFAAATKLVLSGALMSMPVCSLYAPVIGCTLIPYNDVSDVYPGTGHVKAPPM